MRNGAKAVTLAQKAAQLSEYRSPEIIDTLAAAYAEAEKFPEAIITANQALTLAKTQHKTTLTAAIQSQLKLYMAHAPYRDVTSTTQ